MSMVYSHIFALDPTFIADNAGVSVSKQHLFSDACGTPGDVVDVHGEKYDKGTYIGMIKHNVNVVVEGLK